jgi:methylenetetrahydrofolate reductase (NADPH)
MVKTMRDEGQDMSGFELDEPPRMFIGAAANPFADPLEYRAIRLAKKVEAGADFIQTQCVYNLPRFRDWMKMLREAGLTEKVFILAGVTPLKSAGMANYMKNNVAGMDIPESVLKRMAGAPKGKAGEEGMKICLETISELRQIDGVRGVHIMAIESEEKVPEIIKAAGLLPRP